MYRDAITMFVSLVLAAIVTSGILIALSVLAGAQDVSPTRARYDAIKADLDAINKQVFECERDKGNCRPLYGIRARIAQELRKAGDALYREQQGPIGGFRSQQIPEPLRIPIPPQQ